MPPGRYGALDIDRGKVTGFLEKPIGDRSGRINGGFFVLEKEVLNFIEEIILLLKMNQYPRWFKIMPFCI